MILQIKKYTQVIYRPYPEMSSLQDGKKYRKMNEGERCMIQQEPCTSENPQYTALAGCDDRRSGGKCYFFFFRGVRDVVWKLVTFRGFSRRTSSTGRPVSPNA